jgi:serine/threonine-protein kinase
VEGDAHLELGTEVGGYVVDGELGAGGMGIVYSATHPLIGKRAAIKVLKPDLSNTPAAVERFIMEARAVNQIGHPNIVDIFAFGKLPDGRSYYVMDFLTGETLRRRLARGPLHIAEAATIIDEIASALIAAHDKGIIHRDLKPDNVFMVTVPGRWPEAKLLDWGLLKLSSAQSSISGSKYRTLTGSVMGTPVYMSPEQARASESIDFRADIYTLGVMAYEMTSGTVPFKKGSSIDTLLAHQEDPVPSLAAKVPGLPDELVQLIEAMLAKDPDGRPTLAAVRTVIKRLRATKIPMISAAGLQIPSIMTEPPIELTPSMAVTKLRIPERSSAPAQVPRRLSRLVLAAIFATAVAIVILLLAR